MSVTELNEEIRLVLNKIFTYMNSNMNIKKDLDDYYKTIGINKSNVQQRVLNNCTLNYMFERRLGKDKKTIFDFVLADMKELNKRETEIVNYLKNAIDGIFEVRKITQGKFELFNILNEKLYNVHPMAKMTMFRNLSVGHFVLARLIVIDSEYYMYHISDHVTYANRMVAFQIAVSRLAQDPSLFYLDNEDKLKELKANSKNMEKSFKEIFDTDCIITSNKSADLLIEILNDYIETGKKPSVDVVTKHISPYKNDKYFDVSELSAGHNLFAQAKKGFSSQDKKYNVALIADEKMGLAVVPFLDVFFDIFEKDDYKSIKNYKECVSKFIQDRRIPIIPLEMAYKKYKKKFLNRINEILETKFASLDEIIEKYKNFYIENPYTSSTLTLYSSYAFKRLIDVTEENEEEKANMKKVGRNDLCPCGSGLKYKKCCGMAVQI